MNPVVSDPPSVFDQPGYRCRLEWGRRGARRAAERGDALAEVAVKRPDVPAHGRFSLSPLTFEAARPGTRVVLASPNGATCSRFGRTISYLFVGALVNARVVAAAVTRVLDADSDLCVSVLACGERWQETSEDGDLRFAVEDYLGAGAILSRLPGRFSRSPEATLCEAAFRGAANDVSALLTDCGSGRELRARGYGADVAFAARLNVFDAVPVLVDGEKIVRDTA